MHRRFTIRALAAILALAWVAGACTKTHVEDADVSAGGVTDSAPAGHGGAGAAVPARFLSEVAAKSCDEVKTGHVDASLSVDGLGGQTATASASMSADFDTAARRASATIDAGGLMGLVPAQATAPRQGMFKDLLDSMKTPVDVVVDGNSAYVNWTFLASIAGAKTPWVEMTGPTSMDQINPFGGTDSCSFTDVIRGIGGEVTEVGTEQVGGVDTTHYAGQVDLTKALDQVPADRRADVDKALSRLGDATKVPLEAWVDGDGIARRLVIGYDASKLGNGVTGTFTLTVDLSHIGEPVTITVPPADQVTTLDLGSMFGLAGGASGHFDPH